MNSLMIILGAAFIIIFGTIFHFLYDITKHNKLIGFFTAVNESTWEHLKLILAPFFLWLIVDLHFFGDAPSLAFAEFISLLVMLIIIPIIFYTYLHFAKKDILFLDILSFIIAPCVGRYVFSLLVNLNLGPVFMHIGVIGLIIIFLIYLTHTYVPDRNFLFLDPITKKFGLRGHSDPKPKK